MREKEPSLLTSDNRPGILELINSFPTPVFLIDVEDAGFRFFALNQSMEDMLPIPGEQLLGKRVEDLELPVTSEVIEARNEALERCVQTKANTEYMVQARSSGADRWARTSLLPIFDSDDRVVRIMGTSLEVTEQKLTEETLRQSDAQYRRIAEDQTGLIVRWRPDGTRTFVNEAMCRHLGRTLEQLLGESFLDRFTVDEQRALRDRISQMSPEKPTSLATHRSVSPDGTVMWEEWLDRGLFDERGNLVEIQSIGNDVTERKLNEQRKEQLRTLRRKAQMVRAIALLGVRTAHDFTDIVRAIAGYTSLIMDGMPEGAHVSLTLFEPETNQLAMYKLEDRDESETPGPTMLSAEGHPAAVAFVQRKPLLVDPLDPGRFPDESRPAYLEGLRSLYCLPLGMEARILGTMNIASSRSEVFGENERTLFDQAARQVTLVVENALAFREIAELKNKLAEEKLYLEDEIRTEQNFDQAFEAIIGGSPALKDILQQMEMVALTDSTVLILGETGTGKELVARAIHNLSDRQKGTFVKLNCAAIPSGLIESELFGHERGAFTGAIARKIGRFELADKGSLFLDEVGDIPPELQPKLLRVLQEREFERLGSVRTIRANVRLIAATNRNLIEMVSGGEFRPDLYYRLNVFPIRIPPLRDRAEDIPLLVRHFTKKFAQRMNRPIETIPADTMDRLMRYRWPGNIRELENFVERGVILSRGSRLQLPIGELEGPAGPRAGGSMESVERNHILRVLGESNWVVGGAKGAARRLGMKRTTLQSRMRKLGIDRSV